MFSLCAISDQRRSRSASCSFSAAPAKSLRGTCEEDERRHHLNLHAAQIRIAADCIVPTTPRCRKILIQHLFRVVHTRRH